LTVSDFFPPWIHEDTHDSIFKIGSVESRLNVKSSWGTTLVDKELEGIAPENSQNIWLLILIQCCVEGTTDENGNNVLSVLQNDESLRNSL
jgi:hypothetical protein